MKDQEGVRATHTTIHHKERIALGLNLLEYVLLDTIFYLSQNSKGYCYKSIRALSKDLDISVGGIHKCLMRLTDKELLIKVNGGYTASQAYIETVYLERSQSERSHMPERSQSERSVHKVNKSVHFVQKKQMLDIHKKYNRNTHGTPRDNPRVPQQITPLSEAAKRLQARIEAIRARNYQQNTDAA